MTTGIDMEERNDRPVLLLITLAACATLGGIAALWWGDGSVPARHDLVEVAFLAPLIVAGRVFPLQVAFRRQMVTDTAPLFTACLLLPAPLAAATALLAIAPAEVASGLRRELFWRQVVFNSCQAAAGVAAGSYVFSLGSGGSVDLALSSLPGAASLLAAAAAMLAVNDLMVFSVVWAQVGLRFQRMVWDFVRGRGDVVYDVALLGAGAIAAVASEGTVVMLWLLALPVPVLHRAMKYQVALRVQTREAVIALADTVDDRDPYTFGHCRRVAVFSEGICRELGLSRDLTDEIVLAARVHDVGKIGIRDAVLQKPGKLTDEEFAHIKEHPDIGARLTARFPDFAHGTRYIRHHHERWDGKGYPSGLKGREIPMGARIISVADTYDAITSSRVYREGLDDEFARKEMARVAGTQLDREAVEAWFRAKIWDWPVEEEAAQAA
jgi:hypothetical protein